MKTMKRIITLGAAFLFCFAVSMTAMAAWADRQTVTLIYPSTSTNTTQYGGTAGQGTGENYSDSTVPMNYYLKASSGSFWGLKESKIISRGNSWTSKEYNASSGDNLYKVEMMRQAPAYPTTVYWKATGTIRTNK